MESNELFENENNEFENLEQEAEKQEKINAMRDKLARANYFGIVNNGINPNTPTSSMQAIKKLINETIDYFESIEEYEKCAQLKKVINTI